MENIYSLFVAMPELLRSAKLAVEKGQAQGRNESYIKQLSDYVVPALVEALHKVLVLLFKVSCASFPPPISLFGQIFMF